MPTFTGLMAATDLTFATEPLSDGPKNATSQRILAHDATGRIIGGAGISVWPQLQHAAVLQYLFVTRGARRGGIGRALAVEARRRMQELRPELEFILATVQWTGVNDLLTKVYGPPLMTDGDVSQLSAHPVPGSPEGVFKTQRGVKQVYVVDFKAFRERHKADIQAQGPNVWLPAYFACETQYRSGRRILTIR